MIGNSWIHVAVIVHIRVFLRLEPYLSRLAAIVWSSGLKKEESFSASIRSGLASE